MEPRPWHYIRRNETTRQPRNLIFLDVEARTRRVGNAYEQSWRVGAAIFRQAPKSKPVRERTRVYRSPADLWMEVSAFVPTRGRAVLYTHNLGYDVRVGRALTALPALGWRLVAHNLNPAGTWFAWRRDEQSLVMVDSAAVFATTLRQVALWFGMSKVDLPAEDATADRWEARCLRDVEILRTAMVAYLARLESDDLGNWQYTGTGQAWAAFRHRHLTHQMLVHWDEDARAAERRAMWTGRCEAYWHGSLHGVTVDEWDMTMAYPRITATEDVPTALVAAFATDQDMRRWLAKDGYVVLAEVEVSTSEALVPTERAGRVVWPVGTFRTTLWEPEIRLLAQRGASVQCVRGWVYRADPAMESWALWVGGVLAAPDAEVPAWWKSIVKRWATALIGRLAMTYRDWQHVATMPRADVRRLTYIDRDTGQVGDAVQIGHDVFVSTETTEWAESMPMITGYVQSAIRADLATLLAEAPARTVLYSDTDSLLATGEHHEVLAELARAHPEMGLRLKRSWKGVTIRGPRQIITGERVRISGVPVRAQVLPGGDLVGEVWQSLAAAVGASRPDVVHVTPRRWHLRGVDSRRAEGPDGWTTPLSVGATEGGDWREPVRGVGRVAGRTVRGRPRHGVAAHGTPQPALG